MKKLIIITIILLFVSGCSEEHSSLKHKKASPDTKVTSNQASNTGHNKKEDTKLPAPVDKNGPSKTPPERNNDFVVVNKNGTTSPGIAAGNMTPSVSYTINDGHYLFNFKIKNQTEHLFNFHFATNQQFDYIIKDASSKFIVQYSKNHPNSKIPLTVPVKPGAALNYNAYVSELPKGTYTITFVLTSKELQPKATTQFKVN